MFALSGDLPFGTLASPGAGMMPKLVIGLMIAVRRDPDRCAPAKARRSPTIDWSDLPPRRCASSSSTAAAIALYTPLGFLVTWRCCCSSLLFVVERRNVLSRRSPFSVGVTRRRLLLFGTLLQIAAAARHPLVLSLVEATLDSLLLGFSVAFQPDVLLYAFLGCLVGTLVGMLPGIGPLAGISHPAAGHLRPRRHQGDRHAGRHLLRLAVRRLDHLDPDAHPGRGRPR